MFPGVGPPDLQFSTLDMQPWNRGGNSKASILEHQQQNLSSRITES